MSASFISSSRLAQAGQGGCWLALYDRHRDLENRGLLGMDAQRVAAELHRRGFLVVEGDGKHTRKMRIPGEPSTIRFYCVRGSILAGEE